MTFQLPTKDEKADYVLKQFDRIARKYDLANDLISLGMHRLWKLRAIDELFANLSGQGGTAGGGTSEQESAADGRNLGESGLPAGLACTGKSGTYLDVCSGTGDLAMLIASTKGFNGKVVGLDFSAEMLSVARQRSSKQFAAALSADRAVGPLISWQVGDAQSLPFADNSFDGAIISFGLRNLTDLQRGLNEMARVVKPGGRVINLDLGQPDLPIFTPFFLFFFDNIVPLIGEIIQQDRKAYTYLPESRKNYPHPTRLSEMFDKAGMVNVRWIQLALGSVAMHVGTVNKKTQAAVQRLGSESASGPAS